MSGWTHGPGGTFEGARHWEEWAEPDQVLEHRRDAWRWRAMARSPLVIRQEMIAKFGDGFERALSRALER